MARESDLLDMTPADLTEVFAPEHTPGQELAPLAPHIATQTTIWGTAVTARKVEVKRDPADVLRKLKPLAAAAGTEWFYRWPVKERKTGKTKWVEGPSIKCANAVAREYGNNETDVRVFDAGRSFLIYAKFADLETGYTLVRAFQQHKDVARIGGDDEWRRLDMALQIGQSKAIRNVVCNALQTYTDFAMELAKENLVERVGKNIETYRLRIRERMQELGVELGRVEAAVGRPIAEWSAPDVARVIAEIKSVQDNMATAAECWPLPAPPEPRRSESPPAADAPLPEGSGRTPPPADDGQPGPTTQDQGPAGSSPPADGDPPPVKNWRVGDDVLGQGEVIKRLGELCELVQSDADVDAIEQQNADRIAKITGTRGAEVRGMFRDARLKLAANRGGPA